MRLRSVLGYLPKILPVDVHFFSAFLAYNIIFIIAFLYNLKITHLNIF